MIEFKSYSMKKILEMNFRILYSTIKTFSMNLELLNKRRSKRRKLRKVLKQKPKSRPKCNSKWPEWTLMDISQNMVRILLYSTRCIWITSNRSIMTLFQMLDQRNQFHHRFLKDHTANKVHNMVLMVLLIAKTMTMKVKAQA